RSSRKGRTRSCSRSVPSTGSSTISSSRTRAPPRTRPTGCCTDPGAPADAPDRPDGARRRTRSAGPLTMVAGLPRRRDWLAWGVPLAAWIVAGVLLLLKLTIRRRFDDADELFGRWRRGEQTILAFWHEQLVMMPFAYGGRRVCIMVSRHRDGELI